MDRSTELRETGNWIPVGHNAQGECNSCTRCGKRHLNEVSTDHETKALRNSSDPDAGADRGTTLLYYRGPFRVYFNRKEDAPRVVSIDNGSHAWEICAKTLKISGVELRSDFQGSATGNAPCFWLEGVGEVLVDANGNARIVGV
jgi:hypothetical protein